MTGRAGHDALRDPGLGFRCSYLGRAAQTLGRFTGLHVADWPVLAATNHVFAAHPSYLGPIGGTLGRFNRSLETLVSQGYIRPITYPPRTYTRVGGRPRLLFGTVKTGLRLNGSMPGKPTTK